MPEKLPVLSVKNFRGRQQDASPDFYIRTFQEHKKEHPFVMKAHRHDFYMLMLFTKGSGNHNIDFRSYKVAPGALFFMVPGEMHAWQLSADTDGYVVFFNSTFLVLNSQSRALHDYSFLAPGHKRSFGLAGKKDLKELAGLFANVHAESLQESANRHHILRAYLEILLLKCGELFSEGQQAQPAKAGLIARLESLIERHFREHPSLSFYASELAISPTQLNIVCKDYLNKSVTQLSQERLLQEAKRLLVYTPLTVSEISGALNFNDNSYFTRFFKRQTGLTPEQFRKNMLLP